MAKLTRSQAARVAALTRAAYEGGAAMTHKANAGRNARYSQKAREKAAERGETLTDAEAYDRGQFLLRADMTRISRGQKLK